MGFESIYCDISSSSSSSSASRSVHNINECLPVYFYDATDGPGMSRSELEALASRSIFHVHFDNIIVEPMDRNKPALLRPKLARLVCDKNAGSIVICTELDRLGQDAQDILSTIAKFRSCRIRLFCLEISDRVNLASSDGEVFLASITAYANLLKKVQGSRVRIGQEKMRLQGFKPGRRVELSEDNQAKIFLLLSDGQKVSEIARRLGINRWAINRAIKRAIPISPVCIKDDVVGWGIW